MTTMPNFCVFREFKIDRSSQDETEAAMKGITVTSKEGSQTSVLVQGR